MSSKSLIQFRMLLFSKCEFCRFGKDLLTVKVAIKKSTAILNSWCSCLRSIRVYSAIIPICLYIILYISAWIVTFDVLFVEMNCTGRSDCVFKNSWKRWRMMSDWTRNHFLNWERERERWADRCCCRQTDRQTAVEVRTVCLNTHTHTHTRGPAGNSSHPARHPRLKERLSG